MKTRDLEKLLTDAGFVLIRLSAHRVWSNGVTTVAVPHARDVNKMMTRRILKEMAATVTI